MKNAGIWNYKTTEHKKSNKFKPDLLLYVPLWGKEDVAQVLSMMESVKADFAGYKEQQEES